MFRSPVNPRNSGVPAEEDDPAPPQDGWKRILFLIRRDFRHCAMTRLEGRKKCKKSIPIYYARSKRGQLWKFTDGVSGSLHGLMKM